MADVLVTGAAGFLGSHVVAFLRAADHTVVAAGREHGDVADELTWQRMPPGETIVHLAGRSFVPDSWAQPAAFVRTNVQGTVNALDYCRASGARLVYLSSYLYGHPQSLPIPETAPLKATNPYALSKKFAEEACRFYADRYGVGVTVLRVFNVYGPGQPEPFLIPSLVRQVREGTEIVVQDLEPRRDYVYVTDVVAAIAAAVAASSGYRVANIGSGSSHSVAELVGLIQETWQSNLPVRSRGVRRQDEVMDTVADIRAARELLGWQPRFTLAAGLQALHATSGSPTRA